MAQINCYECNETIENNQCATCCKCQRVFHYQHCTVKNKTNWRKLGKYKQTNWQCNLCKNKCECKTKDETINGLNNELIAAKKLIEDLRKELAANTRSTPKSKGRIKSTPKIKAQKTFINTRQNRFSCLEIEDDDISEIPEEVETADFSQVVRRNTKRKKTSKKKVTLIADSHGRNCGFALQNGIGGHVDSFVIAHPGAPFSYVAESAVRNSTSMTTDDHVVVMAGTNDMKKGELTTFDLTSLEKLSEKTNITVVEVPFRYDDKRLNTTIRKNNNILETQAKKAGINFFKLNFLERSCYTQHGLHLNNRGKTKLCNMLGDYIRSKIYENESVTSNDSFLGRL